MSVNLKKVPNTPGVYKFFSNHEIIYIGKAKNLKKGSHLTLENLTKTERLHRLNFLLTK